MRILFILENYYPRIGGVETFFKSLIERLDAEGHHITILTNKYAPTLAGIEQFGDNTTIVRKRFFNRYLFTFGAWIAAMKYARKADLIHTTSYNAAVPAWIAARLTGTKSVITFHERWGSLWMRLPWMSYPVKKLHQLFESMITKFGFDQFIAVSDFTKKSLISGGVNEKKVSRIHNGIKYGDFPLHRGSEKSTPFSFLFYGRVGHAKGVDILLEAIQIFKSNVSDFQFILVLPSEETTLYKKVISIIDELDINKQITILHDLSYVDLMDQIAHVDAVVIPSYSEGFCYAAVETMAIGTPIISSGQGALNEVISGRHITTEKHDPVSFAKAMSQAMNNEWTQTELVKFPLDTTLTEYLKIYKKILSEN